MERSRILYAILLSFTSSLLSACPLAKVPGDPYKYIIKAANIERECAPGTEFSLTACTCVFATDDPRLSKKVTLSHNEKQTKGKINTGSGMQFQDTSTNEILVPFPGHAQVQPFALHAGQGSSPIPAESRTATGVRSGADPNQFFFVDTRSSVPKTEQELINWQLPRQTFQGPPENEQIQPFAIHAGQGYSQIPAESKTATGLRSGADPNQFFFVDTRSSVPQTEQELINWQLPRQVFREKSRRVKAGQGNENFKGRSNIPPPPPPKSIEHRMLVDKVNLAPSHVDRYRPKPQHIQTTNHQPASRQTLDVIKSWFTGGHTPSDVQYTNRHVPGASSLETVNSQVGASQRFPKTQPSQDTLGTIKSWFTGGHTPSDVQYVDRHVIGSSSSASNTDELFNPPNANIAESVNNLQSKTPTNTDNLFTSLPINEGDRLTGVPTSVHNNIPENINDLFVLPPANQQHQVSNNLLPKNTDDLFNLSPIDQGGSNLDNLNKPAIGGFLDVTHNVIMVPKVAERVIPSASIRPLNTDHLFIIPTENAGTGIDTVSHNQPSNVIIQPSSAGNAQPSKNNILSNTNGLFDVSSLDVGRFVDNNLDNNRFPNAEGDFGTGSGVHTGTFGLSDIIPVGKVNDITTQDSNRHIDPVNVKSDGSTNSGLNTGIFDLSNIVPVGNVNDIISQEPTRSINPNLNENGALGANSRAVPIGAFDISDVVPVENANTQDVWETNSGMHTGAFGLGNIVANVDNNGLKAQGQNVNSNADNKENHLAKIDQTGSNVITDVAHPPINHQMLQNTNDIPSVDVIENSSSANQNTGNSLETNQIPENLHANQDSENLLQADQSTGDLLQTNQNPGNTLPANGNKPDLLDSSLPTNTALVMNSVDGGTSVNQVQNINPLVTEPLDPHQPITGHVNPNEFVPLENGVPDIGIVSPNDLSGQEGESLLDPLTDFGDVQDLVNMLNGMDLDTFLQTNGIPIDQVHPVALKMLRKRIEELLNQPRENPKLIKPTKVKAEIKSPMSEVNENKVKGSKDETSIGLKHSTTTKETGTQKKHLDDQSENKARKMGKDQDEAAGKIRVKREIQVESVMGLDRKDEQKDRQQRGQKVRETIRILRDKVRKTRKRNRGLKKISPSVIKLWRDEVLARHKEYKQLATRKRNMGLKNIKPSVLKLWRNEVLSRHKDHRQLAQNVKQVIRALREKVMETRRARKNHRKILKEKRLLKQRTEEEQNGLIKDHHIHLIHKQKEARRLLRKKLKDLRVASKDSKQLVQDVKIIVRILKEKANELRKQHKDPTEVVNDVKEVIEILRQKAKALKKVRKQAKKQVRKGGKKRKTKYRKRFNRKSRLPKHYTGND